MQKKQIIASLIFMLMLAFGASSAFAVVSRSATIRVDGMHCKMCAASVTKALKATAGVEDVEVSAEKGEAVIKFDDGKVSEATLREVINKTGFKALDKNAVAGKSAANKEHECKDDERAPKP